MVSVNVMISNPLVQFQFSPHPTFYSRSEQQNLCTERCSWSPTPGARVSASEGSPVPSYLRLDGVQPSHLHLQQPVLPVEAGHTEIVNASRDVAEGLAILEEAVTAVVDLECSLGGVLQSKDWTTWELPPSESRCLDGDEGLPTHLVYVRAWFWAIKQTTAETGRGGPTRKVPEAGTNVTISGRWQHTRGRTHTHAHTLPPPPPAAAPCWSPASPSAGMSLCWEQQTRSPKPRNLFLAAVLSPTMTEHPSLTLCLFIRKKARCQTKWNRRQYVRPSLWIMNSIWVIRTFLNEREQKKERKNQYYT